MNRCVVLVMAGGLALSAGVASAQVSEWDGEEGDNLWFSGDNWDPDGVPMGASEARLSAMMPVTAQTTAIVVGSVEATSPLIVDSSGLTLQFPSTFGDLTIRGCCTAVVETPSTMMFDGELKLETSASFRGGGMYTANDFVSVAFFRTLFCDDPGTKFVNAGNCSVIGGIQPRNGSVFDNQGTITLFTNTSLSQSGGGSFKNSGTIGSLISTTDTKATISAPLEMTGGTLQSSLGGTLELSGLYDISGGTIRVNATTGELGSAIEFRGNAAGTIDAPTITGQGRVLIRNGNASVGSVGSTVTSSVEGIGLQFEGTTNVTSQVVNTKSMTIQGTVQGSGSITTTRNLEVVAGATTKIPITASGDGSIFLESSLNTEQTISLEGGGELILPGGTQLAPNGSNVGDLSGNAGEITANHQLNGSGGISVINVPTTFVGGGVLSIDGTLQFKCGGSFDSTVFNSVVGGVTEILGNAKLYSLDGCTFEGDSAMRIGGNLSFDKPTVGFSGGFSFNEMTGADGLVLGFADFQGDTGIINTGTLTTRGVPDWGGRLSNQGSGAMTLGRMNLTEDSRIINDATVTQNGNLVLSQGAIITNNSNWMVMPGGNLALSTGIGAFANHGAYTFAPSGAFASVSVGIPFSNTGTVFVQNGLVSFSNVAQEIDGVLTGGTWVLGPNGSVTFNSPLVRVTGATKIRDESNRTDKFWKNIEEWETGVGEWMVDQALNSLESMSGGEWSIEGGTTRVPLHLDMSDAASITIDPDASLESDTGVTVGDASDETPSRIVGGGGGGRLGPVAPPTVTAPLVTLNGELVPGGEGDAGALLIDGDLDCNGTARLVIDLGAGAHDTIQITGSAEIDGALVYDIVPGDEPSLGDERTIVTALSRTGAFSSVEGPTFGAFLRLAPVYTPGEVRLIATCGADLTTTGAATGSTGFGVPDAIVDLSDLLFFVNDWNSEVGMAGAGARADLTTTGAGEADPGFGVPDGNVDLSDLLYYVNRWLQGRIDCG